MLPDEQRRKLEQQLETLYEKWVGEGEEHESN